jgi:hypothetical protein
MATSRFIAWFFAALVAVGCGGSNTPVTKTSGSEPLVLSAPDGSLVNLDQTWHEHEVNVLIFWSSQCPCVRRYQSRVDALLRDFATDRVRIIAVSSNAGESYADDLAVAKDRGVFVPILRDESGRVAQAVGARSTPTVVVVDRLGRIRYRGWIDNEQPLGDPNREPWLDRAIRGVLEDRDDFSARSPVYGCPITRSLFAQSPTPCCNHR